MHGYHTTAIQCTAVLCLQSKLQNHGPVQSKSQDDSLLPLTIPKVTSWLKLFAHFIDEILIVANFRTESTCWIWKCNWGHSFLQYIKCATECFSCKVTINFCSLIEHISCIYEANKECALVTLKIMCHIVNIRFSLQSYESICNLATSKLSKSLDSIMGHTQFKFQEWRSLFVISKTSENLQMTEMQGKSILVCW
jgi:hypothetical protein